MCGNRLSRRQYLTATAVGTVTLAGCTSGDEPDDPEPDSNSSDTDSNGDVLACDKPPLDAEPADDSIHEEYETTPVAVQSAACETLGTVTAAIADNSDLRYTGLSDTESLPEDRGMLFVFDEASELTFVMREMDFPIDIVYADADGVITSIHHARAPGPDENGNNLEYPGRGQYVLEVVSEWTTERGVEEGDRLVFELP